MSATKPLGYIDFGQLINDSKGIVEGIIFDSGVFRVGKGNYVAEEWNKESYKIKAVGSRGNSTFIIVPKKIPISYQTIAFIGLYIGDGAKASSGRGSGTISLSKFLGRH